jgi:hypothetical protein
MNDTPTPATWSGPDRGRILRDLVRSVALNAIIPYIVYRLTSPHYSSSSVTPLLFATISPVLTLAFGLFRRRAVDAIGVLVMLELGTLITVTVLAQDIGRALVLRSFQPGLTGIIFFLSVLIRRPVIYYLAREFVVGDEPHLAAEFDAAHVRDKGRTFSIATIVWSIGLVILSAMHLTLALSLKPATYLLYAPILSITIHGALLVWTAQYARARLLPR